VEAPSGTLCVEKFMKQANEVIDGKPGEPKPGALCRVCEFRQVCPAQV